MSASNACANQGGTEVQGVAEPEGNPLQLELFPGSTRSFALHQTGELAQALARAIAADEGVTVTRTVDGFRLVVAKRAQKNPAQPLPEPTGVSQRSADVILRNVLDSSFEAVWSRAGSQQTRGWKERMGAPFARPL